MTDTGKPIAFRCRLDLPDEEAFIRKYAAYISKSSVFAKTGRPREVGEEILFEFCLTDGTELLRGLGRVAWNRKISEAGKPPGMSLRIIKLGKKGKAMLERVAAYKAQRKTEVGESRETPTPPVADRLGESAERQPRGADTDMTDEHTKSAAKIDLDAIDSMLDQIAKAPIAKKKRVVRKRSAVTASAKSPATVRSPEETVSAPEIEPDAPSSEIAPEEPPVIVEAVEDPQTSEVAPEAESVIVEAAAAESVSTDAVPEVADALGEAADEVPSVDDFEPEENLASVEEPPLEEATAPSPVPDLPPEPVLDAEEIEELSADEMILEAPEMSVVEVEEEDAVMDLGPESETSPDVEPAENVSVESVVPPPPSRSSVGLDSSLPAASVEFSRPSVPAPPRIDPRAPIYGSYPSVSSAPPPPTPSAVSSYPPFERSSFAPAVDPHAPIYSSYPPPAPQASISSAPPMPSVPPPMPSVPPPMPSVPPPMPSVPPPRPSQVPVVEMAAEELQGILGAPTSDDTEVKTAMIQEDELDALLNALEGGRPSSIDMEDVEEISDFEDLDVVEVDD